MTTIVDFDTEQLDGSAAHRSPGFLLRSGDDDYDEVRQVHNGLIDRRPALIARCRGAADIADAVKFARANGLEISVRGGGHNVAGRAVIDDALMIDLSLMKGVHVDPARARRAPRAALTWRRAQPRDGGARARRHGRRHLDDRVSQGSRSAAGWAG